LRAPAFGGVMARCNPTFRRSLHLSCLPSLVFAMTLTLFVCSSNEFPLQMKVKNGGWAIKWRLLCHGNTEKFLRASVAILFL